MTATRPIAKAYISIPETATFLGVSYNHAYNLVSRGEIPSVYIGRLRKVPLDQLRRTLKRRTDEATRNARSSHNGSEAA